MSTRASEATSLAAELTDEAIRAWSRRTRVAKGLPPKITDAATLRRLVTLAYPSGSASDASSSASLNSKGPGLTNRDLRRTTPHSSEEVIGA